VAIDELRGGDGLIAVSRSSDRQASQYERDQPAAELRVNLHALVGRLCGEFAARLADAVAPHLAGPDVGSIYTPPLTGEQREALRRDWERSSTAEVQTGKVQVFEDGAAYAPDLGSLAGQLFPLLLKRLREMAPAEACALAGAAAGVPGLDALACAAGADWLEERGLQLEAAKVRTLPLKDGDLVLVTPDRHLTPEATASVREGLEDIQLRLAAAGRSVVITYMPHGFTAEHLRTGQRPEGT
jgi:hypothetical protein